jgi:hypothetical protein
LELQKNSSSESDFEDQLKNSKKVSSSGSRGIKLFETPGSVEAEEDTSDKNQGS